jgi:hypothetical protein
MCYSVATRTDTLVVMEEHFDVLNLKAEDGATELMESAAMRPYMELAKAVIRNQDATAAVQKIAELSLDQRYTWRVVSALKWAFADFDTLPVQVDRETLPTEDLNSISELSKPRPLQFCLFLSTLYGPEQMERIVLQAVAVAKNASPT